MLVEPPISEDEGIITKKNITFVSVTNPLKAEFASIP
jgi:hypothetical protein